QEDSRAATSSSAWSQSSRVAVLLSSTAFLVPGRIHRFKSVLKSWCLRSPFFTLVPSFR
ncbi:hypothetical protein NDU88_004015, partial [Pleurodeles waltl]